MLKPNRRPTAPGAILSEMYLKPRGISQAIFADAIGVSRKHISEIVNGHSRIAPDVAVRLARALRTTPDLWLNLQRAVDVWDSEQKLENWCPSRVFDSVPA